MPIIDISHFLTNAQLWTITGIGTGIISKLIILLISWKRNYNLKQTILLITSILIGSSVGSLILPSYLGALIGAASAAVIVHRVFGIRDDYFGILTITGLLTIAISRMGCFLGGCCFGSPTHLFTGVCYPEHSFAQTLHSTLHLTSGGTSLPVHPVQLYEMVWLILGAVAIVKMEKRVNSSVALIPLGLAILFVGRFGIEFIRDMTNVWWSVKSFAGLSFLQWFLLAASGISLGLFVLLKNRTAKQFSEQQTPFSRELFTIAIMYATTVAIHGRVVDQLVVQLALFLPLSMILVIAPLFRRFSVPQTAISYGLITLLFIPLIPRVMQVVADDSNDSIHTDKAWIYVVDPESKKLVRVGQTEDSPEKIDSVLSKLSADSVVNGKGIDSVITEKGPWNHSFQLTGTSGFLSRVTVNESSGCGGPTETRTYTDMNGGISSSAEMISTRAHSPLCALGMDFIGTLDSWSYRYTSSGNSDNYGNDMYSSNDTSFEGVDPVVYAGFRGRIEGTYVGSGIGVYGLLTDKNRYTNESWAVTPRLYFRAGAPKCHFWTDWGGVVSPVLAPTEAKIGLGHTVRNVSFHYGNWSDIRDFGGFGMVQFPVRESNNVRIALTAGAETQFIAVQWQHLFRKQIEKAMRQ